MRTNLHILVVFDRPQVSQIYHGLNLSHTDSVSAHRGENIVWRAPPHRRTTILSGTRGCGGVSVLLVESSQRKDVSLVVIAMAISIPLQGCSADQIATLSSSTAPCSAKPRYKIMLLFRRLFRASISRIWISSSQRNLSSSGAGVWIDFAK